MARARAFGAALVAAAATALALAPAAAATTTPALPIPDDPWFGEQWALYNWGQPLAGSDLVGTPGVDVRAPEAWRTTTGSPDVLVAVLDGGTTFDHPDLTGAHWTNPGESGGGRQDNGADDDGNGYVDDWRGWDFTDGDNDPTEFVNGSTVLTPHAHGTAVISVIAAAQDGAGVTGVAPDVTILPLRIFGVQQDPSQETEAAAIRYAVDAGASIVNLSYGTTSAITYTAVEEVMAAAPDVLFVAGAGNDGGDNDARRAFPCNVDLPNVLCVGAVDWTGAPAVFGYEGGASAHGATTVDLHAPGDMVLVAQPGTSEVFGDPLEQVDPSRVTGDAQWAVVPGRTGSAVAVTADEAAASGQYELGAIDLTGRSGCRLQFHTQSDLGEGFPVGNARPEYRVAGSSFWSFDRQFGIQGAVRGDVPQWERRLVDLSFLPPDAFPVDLRLQATVNPGERVAFDDVAVICLGPSDADRGFGYVEGTSFAAPVAAGVAALVRSAAPELTAAEVRNVLVTTARRAAVLQGLSVSGGIIDAQAALVAVGVAPADEVAAAGRSGPAVAAGPAGGLEPLPLPEEAAGPVPVVRPVAAAGEVAPEVPATEEPTDSPAGEPDPPAEGSDGLTDGRSNWIMAVPTVAEVPWSLDEVVLAGFLAVAMVLLVVFPSQLFNSTFSAHYDEIVAPVRRLVPALARRAAADPTTRRVAPRLVAIVTAASLLHGLLDPQFGVNRASLVLTVGFVAGIASYVGVAALAARWFGRWALDRAGTYYRFIPASLAVGAVCVLVSRLVGFLPGYLYVLVGGLAFLRPLDRDEAGRHVLVTSAALITTGVVGWLAYGPVSARVDAGADGLGWLLLEAALGATFVVGVQGSLFRLVPLRFMAGEKVFAWRRWVWAGVYLVVVFLFVHIIARPQATADPSGIEWAKTLSLFLAFGGASVAFWAYWRRRDRIQAAAAPEEEPAVR